MKNEFDGLPVFAADDVLTREIFGNHSLLSQRVFYALSVAAIAVFAWGYYRRARLWRLGRRGVWNVSLPAAVRHLLLDVLMQRRVFGRRWASLGHVLLFAGFMGLLLATTLLSVEHWLAGMLRRAAGDPVFHKGVYFAAYEVLADAFGLALLAGCAVFAVRRWRRNAPVRRDASIDHRWTDWWALGGLAFLGLSGYAVEGLRIIYEHSRGAAFSFVGARFAEMFRALGIGDATAATVHFYSWWVHAVISLLLIASIPYMRLVHSLAAAMRLVMRPAQLGRMAKLDAADVEETGLIGAASIRDFARVQLLELDACMACGRCEAACPAFEAGKPLSPRAVVQDLRGHLNEQESQRIRPAAGRENLGHAGAAPPTARSMHGDVISADTLWSCTACSACVDVCPVGVAPLNMITDMRRYLIGEGEFRGSPAKALQNMARAGNPWGLPPQDRLEWIAGLNVPTAADGADFDVLYWVGCAASYDRRLQRIARSVASLLTAANVRFAILGAEERCTGESARRMGDEFLFQELAAQNIQTLDRYGVRKNAKIIVSHCPHCVNSFKQDYPQLGGDYEVFHHTEYLAKLINEGRLPIAKYAARSEEPGARDSIPLPTSRTLDRVTYHDPCYLARVGNVTEPPRQLLQLATGDGQESTIDERGASDSISLLAARSSPLVEMPRNRRQTSCCGAGGGRMWFDDPPAERVGTGRVQEAIATGAKTVAVSCPFCLVMMHDGLAAREAGMHAKDVAEILAEALIPPAGSIEPARPGGP
jgi:Fe-S oxidoreductase